MLAAETPGVGTILGRTARTEPIGVIRDELRRSTARRIVAVDGGVGAGSPVRTEGGTGVDLRRFADGQRVARPVRDAPDGGGTIVAEWPARPRGDRVPRTVVIGGVTGVEQVVAAAGVVPFVESVGASVA